MSGTSAGLVSRPLAASQAHGQPRWPACAGRIPPAAGLVSRPETAGMLAGLLASDRVVMLVPGLGGAGRAGGWPTGKTWLAVQVAQSLRRSGEVDLLVWVTASSRSSVLAGYAEAAAAVGLDAAGGAGLVAGRFLAWLAATDRRWLVVLDDVREPGDVQGLWPRGESGRVLATAPGPDSAGAGVRLAEVPVFSIREAVAFLSGALTADPDQRAGALDLAEVLGGEPAALAQAVAVIADSELDCRGYRDLLAGHRQDAGADVAVPEVTWRLSAEHAGLIAGEGTWLLLVLVSVLDGHGIPLPVLTAPATARYLDLTGDASSPDRVLVLLAALEQAGLAVVDAAGDPPLVTVCAAVQAAVRTVAGAGLVACAVRAAADALVQAWPRTPQPAWAEDRFRACAGVLRQAGSTVLWGPEGCHRVLWAAGLSLEIARMPGPAAGWWRHLTARARMLCGEDHPDTLAAAGRLAAALLADGLAGDGLAWAGQVLEARSRVYGPDHPVTITARTVFGQALAAAGKPGDAAGVLAVALAASEEVHGPDSPVTLAVVEEYATACLAAGLPGEAVTARRRVLESRRRLQSPAGPPVIDAGLALAAACLAAGQPQEAARVCERLLDEVRQVHGTGHPALVPVTAGLAAAAAAQGRISEALRLREEVCAASEQIVGPAHPDTLRRHAELARAYWEAGQATDAVTLLTEAIRQGERMLPPGDECAVELAQALAAMTGGRLA